MGGFCNANAKGVNPNKKLEVDIVDVLVILNAQKEPVCNDIVLPVFVSSYWKDRDVEH